MKKIALFLLWLISTACNALPYSHNPLPYIKKELFPSSVRQLAGEDSSRIYHFKNSATIVSLQVGTKHEGGSSTPYSALFLLNNGDNNWQEISPPSRMNVPNFYENIYISERNYIDVITNIYDPNSSTQRSKVLYESRDKGTSWIEIKRFPGNFSCGTPGGKDPLVVTDSQIFCSSMYTSKYDSLDPFHFLILDGMSTYIFFKNESEVAAITSAMSTPKYKPSSVYLSKDGGITWSLKGAIAPHTLIEFRNQPLIDNECLYYISDDKIIYTNSGTFGGYFSLKVLAYNNGVYSEDPDYGQQLKCKNCQTGNFKFSLADNLTYLTTSETDVFITYDGGKKWSALPIEGRDNTYPYNSTYKYFTDLIYDQFKNLYFIATSNRITSGKLKKGLFTESFSH